MQLHPIIIHIILCALKNFKTTQTTFGNLFYHFSLKKLYLQRKHIVVSQNLFLSHISYPTKKKHPEFVSDAEYSMEVCLKLAAT